MQHLTNFLTLMYNYIFSLIGLDFSNYSGELPQQLIDMYAYVEKFFELICIFFLVYLIYNFIYFVISVGGVRKK